MGVDEGYLLVMGVKRYILNLQVAFIEAAVLCSIILRYALPVLSTCPLYTKSGCGKARRVLIGPW